MNVTPVTTKPQLTMPKGPEVPKEPATPQDMLGIQKQTDGDQEKMELASNLQKKGHDTIMAIIANIR